MILLSTSNMKLSLLEDPPILEDPPKSRILLAPTTTLPGHPLSVKGLGYWMIMKSHFESPSIIYFSMLLRPDPANTNQHFESMQTDE